jgi:hypothetical protein
MQGDEVATISIDNPEFEGITVEEEPVQESEEEEEEQQPGVLEGAVDTEASVAAAEGVGEAEETAAEQELEAESGAEGSGAQGDGEEDDDGFVKVRVLLAFLHAVLKLLSHHLLTTGSTEVVCTLQTACVRAL